MDNLNNNDNQKSAVALVPCAGYDEELVYEGVRKGIELLGGISAFVNEGEKVLLKPNLLRKAKPEQAITTHPSVFKAVARLLSETGCDKVSYGDSPGVGSGVKAAETCGIAQAAMEHNVSTANFDEGITVPFDEGQSAQQFILCPGAVEADCIINLCKMKTHALQRVTGAVKNIYGCMSGFNKGLGHVKYPSPDSFAEMLIDMHKLLKPRLHIMDGIIAMEGNGPASGEPVPMNVLLLSEDPVALDSVFCRLIDVEPQTVPTNDVGSRQGLGICDLDQIRILTPEGELDKDTLFFNYGNPHFDVYRGVMEHKEAGRGEKLMRWASRKPVIIKDKCIGCRLCVESCPVEGKAVHMVNDRPRYQYNKCIRCYCCQEMCPQKAIEVKNTWVSRLLSRS